MKKSWTLSVIVCLATLVIASNGSAQTTLTIQNSTPTVTGAAVYEVSPTQTSTQLYTLNNGQSANTKLPADGNTLISLQMQQNNANVANTPFLITNAKLANLITTCYSGIPPCIQLTPASVMTGTKEANQFLAERSTTKEYCLLGVLSMRNNTRYFTLANGLVVRLMGALAKVESKGKVCLCGVLATPPEPLDTIAFDVRGTCAEHKPAKK